MPNWRFRPDSQPADAQIINKNELEISFDNKNKKPGKDWVVYEFLGPLDLPYWDSITLRLRENPGTLFTFHIVYLNDQERYLNYVSGDGTWQEYTFNRCRCCIQTKILTKRWPILTHETQ